MKKAIIAIILVLALLFPAADAEYIGSRPASGIYLTQSIQHTCTLIATTMMLRNHANRADSMYEQIDEEIVRKYGWVDGMVWDFNVGSIKICISHTISHSRDKKGYLIECLRAHPEGIVIYDADMPHAIWLFGYDEATDTFYCADTTTEVAGRPIRLEQSILRGRTQEEKIARIDRVWYVCDENGEI